MKEKDRKAILFLSQYASFMRKEEVTLVMEMISGYTTGFVVHLCIETSIERYRCA